jgi:hypothetical protein
LTSGGSIDIQNTGVLGIGEIGGSVNHVNLTADAFQVGSIVAAGTVTLTAVVGGISDDNGGDQNVVADTLWIQSVGGVTLDTDVSSLNANVTGNGSLAIANAGQLTIGVVSAASGDVTISAAGLQLGLIETPGAVDLTAHTLGITDNGQFLPSVVSGSLDLTSVGDVFLRTDITTLGATITGSGGLWIDDIDALSVGDIQSGAGTIVLLADALTLGEIVSAGDVFLVARTGQVIGLGGDPHVTAESLWIQSATGVNLNTTVSQLDIIVLDIGDVLIDQTGRDLTASYLEVFDGDVTITNDFSTTLRQVILPMRQLAVTSANVTFENALSSLNSLFVTSIGDVSFQGPVTGLQTVDVGAGGTVTIAGGMDLLGALVVVGDQIDVTGQAVALGGVSLTAENRIEINGGVDAGDSAITLRANQDQVGDAGLTQYNGIIRTNSLSPTALLIDVGGTGNASVEFIEAVGGVRVDVGGAVVGPGGGAAIILASELVVSAGTGVDLLTTAPEVSAEVTGTGAIDLAVFGSVNANRLVTADGPINLTSYGDIFLGEVVAGSDGALALVAEFGTVAMLNPAGPRIVAGSLEIVTGGNVVLMTDLSSLSANMIGPGGSLEIDNLGGLNAVDVSAVNGSVRLKATELEIGRVVAQADVQLTASAGGIVGDAGQTSNITAGELTLASVGDVALKTDVGALTVNITGAGGLNIHDIGSLALRQATVNQGGVVITSSGQLLVIGNVLAGAGSIDLGSDAGDVFFFNSDAVQWMRIATQGDGAEITVSAGGIVSIIGPGFVLFQTADSQYFNVSPQLTVTPIDVPGLDNVQVNFDGSAFLEISFGLPIGPAEFFFTLTVDWGDEVEVFTSVSENNVVTPFTRGSQQDGQELVFVIRHDYIANPNAIDANAPIPISVAARNSTVNGGPADIRFFANGNDSEPIGSRTNLILNVPVSGLAIPPPNFFRPVLRELFLDAVRPPIDEPFTPRAFDSSRVAAAPMVSTEVPSTYERYYVLRIVVQIDEFGNTRELEDIRIDEEYLRNLPELFERLPDDRYRLYMIREDGVAQMVTDVIIRGGRSAETVDDFDESALPVGETSGDQGEPAEPRVDIRSGAWSRTDPSRPVVTKSGHLLVNGPGEYEVSSSGIGGGVSVSHGESPSRLPLAQSLRLSRVRD